MQVIISAIGFAKDEIMWYFHHLENDLVGKKKGKKEPRSHDVGVMELMWLLKEICRHLMQNVDGMAFETIRLKLEDQQFVMK